MKWTVRCAASGHRLAHRRALPDAPGQRVDGARARAFEQGHLVSAPGQVPQGGDLAGVEHAAPPPGPVCHHRQRVLMQYPARSLPSRKALPEAWSY